MATRRALLILVIIIIVGSVSFTLWRSQIHFVTRTSPGINLGSKHPGPYSAVGWLMPSDTRIATSYVANQSFDHNYMNAYVTVLSSSAYQLQAGTDLSFGLYINSLLMGTRACFTDNPTGSGGWASVGTIVNNGSSLKTFGCGVSLFKTPFPAGSIVTVAVWSNHPVWVQVDTSPTTNSYETSNTTSPAQPPTVDPTSGTVAPRTVTIDAYSD
jgi:hypothetical protein